MFSIFGGRLCGVTCDWKCLIARGKWCPFFSRIFWGDLIIVTYHVYGLWRVCSGSALHSHFGCSKKGETLSNSWALENLKSGVATSATMLPNYGAPSFGVLTGRSKKGEILPNFLIALLLVSVDILEFRVEKRGKCCPFFSTPFCFYASSQLTLRGVWDGQILPIFAGQGFCSGNASTKTFSKKWTAFPPACTQRFKKQVTPQSMIIESYQKIFQKNGQHFPLLSTIFLDKQPTK